MNSQYPRNSLGHILDSLRDLGIPETISGSVTVGDGKVNYTGETFAHYKYFDGIEQPLFRFSNIAYNQHRHIIDHDEKLKSNFHLSLSNQNTPGLIVTGFDASQNLRDFIKRTMLTSIMTEPGYKLKTESGAFFQGGAEDASPDHDPFMGYLFIEFWKSEGAQAFVDYINENFIRELPGFHKGLQA